MCTKTHHERRFTPRKLCYTKASMDDKNVRPSKKIAHLTLDQIRTHCLEEAGADKTQARVCRINEELAQGFTDVGQYPRSVTFYGSARFTEEHPAYIQARRIANRISTELGFTVITGGGPGIMEAANRGAFEAKGNSVGLTIKLPTEQFDNPYLTDSVPFYFFFARKVALSFAAETALFFPGGFGTLDEFFEIITLAQTGKIPPLPLVLVGKSFWDPIATLMERHLYETYGTINREDLKLYTITDDDDVVIDIIRKAKSRTDLQE